MCSTQGPRNTNESLDEAPEGTSTGPGDGFAIGALCTPCLAVWEWSNRFKLLQRVTTPAEVCSWQQLDPDPSAESFPRHWPRRLQLASGRVPSCVVVMTKQRITWYTYQVDTLSHKWTLRTPGHAFTLSGGAFVGLARDLGDTGYTYAITQQPSSVVCLNGAAHLMARFHTAFDTVKRLQLGAFTCVSASCQSVWVGCSSGQVLELTASTLRPVRRFPYQVMPRRRLQPLVGTWGGHCASGVGSMPRCVHLRCHGTGTGGVPTSVLGDHISGQDDLRAEAEDGSSQSMDRRAQAKAKAEKRARLAAIEAGEQAPGTLSTAGWDVCYIGMAGDARHIVVAYGEGTCTVLDLPGDKMVACNVPHFGSVRSLSWHPSSVSPHALASGSSDQSLAIWQFKANGNTTAASTGGSTRGGRRGGQALDATAGRGMSSAQRLAALAAPVCTKWKNQPRCIFDIPATLSVGMNASPGGVRGRTDHRPGLGNNVLALSYRLPTPTAVAMCRVSRFRYDPDAGLQCRFRDDFSSRSAT